MFVKIIKYYMNGAIEVWLMKDVDNGVRLYYLGEDESRKQVKDLLEVLKDFPVVCLEQSIITNAVDIESILM